MNSELDLNLSRTQIEKIEACLAELACKTGADVVLLANVRGDLIAIRGFTGQGNPMTVSTLATSSFLASSEMMKLLGYAAELTQCLYESEGHALHSFTVGPGFLLVVAFNTHTTQLGLVRTLARNTVACLREIMAEKTEETEPSIPVDSGFAKLLNDELDRSFKD
jgi:hypothetical protein